MFVYSYYINKLCLLMNNQKDSKPDQTMTNESFHFHSGDQPKRKEDKEQHLQVPKHPSNSKHNIFQQFIAPTTTFTQPKTLNDPKPLPSTFADQEQLPAVSSKPTKVKEGAFGYKNSPNSTQRAQQSLTINQSHTPTIQNSKKEGRNENYLSNFGKQAMGGAPKTVVLSKMIGQQERDRVEQFGTIQPQSDQVTKHDSKSKLQNQSSFEDTKLRQTLPEDTGKAVQLAEDTQMNNTLNQGLLKQIHPQTIKRGQRRHFPSQTKNEFELLFSKEQQQQQPPKVATQTLQIPLPSQSSGGQKQPIIRRGAFPTKHTKPNDQNSSEQLGAPASTSARISQNPRQAYQQSIFQKNRQKQASKVPQANPEQAQEYTYKGLQGYGQQTVFSNNKHSPKQIQGFRIESPKNKQFHQRTTQGTGEGQTFSLQHRNRFEVNANNISIGSNADNSGTMAKDSAGGLFSPQPKSGSQMSGYNEQATINPNTAQIIRRKTKPKNLDKTQTDGLHGTGQHWTERQFNTLNKTDEKPKQSDQTPSMPGSVNFRKYKKLNSKEDPDMNVLGQPKQIGTGLYHSRKRSFITKRGASNSKNGFTSITLPSMQGGSNAMNVTGIGSFAQSSEQPPPDTSKSFVRQKRKQSIFSSNFSGTENATIKDVDYKIKGQNDTQRIAWEIKFTHEQPGSAAEVAVDQMGESMQQDQVATELPKHIKQNRSPKNFKFKTQTSNPGLNTSSQVEKRVKLKVGLKPPTLGSISPTKNRGNFTSKNKSMFGGIQSSGEVSNKDVPSSFRRNAGAPFKLQNISQTIQMNDKIKVPIDKKLKKLDASCKLDNTFKKGSKSLRQRVKQTTGSLPAELIVKSLKRDEPNNVTIDSKERFDMGQSPSKLDQQNPRYAAADSQNDDSLIGDGEAFEYQGQKDQDLFQTTTEEYFNQYMNEHEQVSRNLPATELSQIQASEVNPSANPHSSVTASEHQFDRQSKQSEERESIGHHQPKIQLTKLKLMTQSEQDNINALNHSQTSRPSQHKLLLQAHGKSSQHNSCIELVPNQESSNQERWSGHVSAQTQLEFNRLITQNKEIKDKLLILQNVGITNESNSLFKEIVKDIQNRARISMTHSEIVNCIKASSFGNPSALEPKSFDQKVEKKKQPLKKVQRSNGYSQYQSQFMFDSFKLQKSKSLKQVQMKQRNQFILQSHKLPNINGLNSERNLHQVRPKGVPALPVKHLDFFNQAHACKVNSNGSANTARLSNQMILKKSFQSLGQNRQVNPIRAVRVSDPNLVVLSAGLRQIQSERQLTEEQAPQRQNMGFVNLRNKHQMKQESQQHPASGESPSLQQLHPNGAKQTKVDASVFSIVENKKKMQQKKQEIKALAGGNKFTSYNVGKLDHNSTSSQNQCQSLVSLPSLQGCQSNPKKGSNESPSNENDAYSNKYMKTKQLDRGALFANNQSQSKQPEEFGLLIKWRQGEIVGLGSSSIVYSAINVANNALLAVKKFKVVSDITGIDQAKLKTIKNEIQKYKQLEHENVVKFHGCELLDQFFCMYLEQMETSLANVLSEYGYFDESTIRFYTKQILCGLEYLHSKKIKHLDLKCSNILTNNDGIVKLCDFGSAREFKKGSNSGSSSFTSLKSQIVGSVQWMAPEVITEEGSGSKSDIWSLGCTIVEMFIGGNPWGDRIDDQNIYLAQQTILKSELLPSIPQNRKVSQQCEDFIMKCLTRDYDSRPTAADLLSHPWMQLEK